MKLIEVKTADLVGLALNYAVGIADGRELELPSTKIGRQYVAWCDPFVVKREGHPDFHDKTRRKWEPSTDWAHCGPLIDKYQIWLMGPVNSSSWKATIHDDECMTAGDECGETALISACRAIVATKLGDTVQVPAELIEVST